MTRQLLDCKIDTKINKDTLIALENYMAINNRNKSDAIRILLVRSLEMENQLKTIKK